MIGSLTMRRWVLIVLGCLIPLAVVRMWWSARPGSEEFASSWHSLRKATLGWIVEARSPAELYPDQQLDFWDSEIDRILDLHPKDAELHAAAAVMLDQPCLLFLSDLAERTLSNPASQTFGSSPIPLSGLQSARERYDSESSERIMRYAQIATELDADDPRWWRVRAVLLWTSALSNRPDQPRDSNWQKILQEARVHDPGNALYDLIEMRRVGGSAIEFDANGNDLVADAKAWNRVIALAENAASAAHFTLAEPASSGLVRLHRLSRHPTATTTESIRHRFLSQRGPMLITLGIRQLLWMSDVSPPTPGETDRDGFIKLARRLSDLATHRSDATVRHDTMTYFMRSNVLQKQKQIELEDGKDSLELTRDLDAAMQAQTNHAQQVARWKAAGISPVSPWFSVVDAVSLSLTTTLLFLATLWTIPWVLFSRQFPDRGFEVSLTLLFLASVCGSYFFWGIGPAGVVSETAQHWVLTCLTFLLTMVVLSGLAKRLKLRQQFSIRSLMFLSTIIAVVMQVIFHWQLGWESIGIPIRLNASANGLIQELSRQNSASLDQWLGPAWVSRSVAQWLANDGTQNAVITFAVLSMLAALFVYPRDRWMTSVIRVSLAGSLVMFTAWALVQPSVYQATRPNQVRLEQYIHDLDQYYQPFEKQSVAQQ